jgi:hypothetical protein
VEPKEIKIDYDRIDVARIMDQIKDRTAAESPNAPDAAAAGPAPPTVRESPPGPGRMRAVLLRLMSPLRPLIKLLILPVDEEYRRTFLVLDQANRRIDRLEIDRDRMSGELDRMREYTKLLHHLCHNLVVELSKLKVEEETLKTKTRIMEKDFDFLGKREKALEKEILK